MWPKWLIPRPWRSPGWRRSGWPCSRPPSRGSNQERAYLKSTGFKTFVAITLHSLLYSAMDRNINTILILNIVCIIYQAKRSLVRDTWDGYADKETGVYKDLFPLPASGCWRGNQEGKEGRRRDGKEGKGKVMKEKGQEQERKEKRRKSGGRLHFLPL